MTPPGILALEGVELDYRIEDNLIPVLRGVDLGLDEGEFLLVQGELGAGKSALMNVLAGLEAPSRGRFLLGGIEVSSFEFGAARRIFESFVGFFAPWFRLDARVRLTDLVRDSRHASRFDPERVFDLLGLDPDDDRPFGSLDARGRRRVDCARVLLRGPRLLIADLTAPPWGSPPELEDLGRIHHELGISVIATAEDDCALEGARRLRLESGRVIERIACA